MKKQKTRVWYALPRTYNFVQNTCLEHNRKATRRQKERQTGRQRRRTRGRQTERQTGKQRERQRETANRQAGRKADMETEKREDIETRLRDFCKIPHYTASSPSCKVVRHLGCFVVFPPSFQSFILALGCFISITRTFSLASCMGCSSGP